MGNAVRKQVEEEAEDQDWIFSYADLMSLLLCFFILLFAISVIDPNKAKKVSERIKEAFEGIDSTVVPEVQVFDKPTERQARAFQLLVKMLNIDDSPERIVGVVEDVHAERKSFSDLAKMIDPEAKEEVVTEINTPKKEVALVLPSDVFFASGSADLSTTGRQRLRKLIPELREASRVADVQVIGHTDGAPLNSRDRRGGNWGLASDRALAVASVLMRSGIPKRRILISTAGSSRPAVSEDRLKGRDLALARSRNRRIEIILRKE